MSKDLRSSVEDFYASAARDPRAELCCPIPQKEEDISHIPEEVLSVSYGCGSPVAESGASAGDALIDLGCGAGIDCFMAARLVGEGGSVVGVDMTDDMLSKARAASGEVSRRLGYDVVSFKKGFLEELPAENESADIVISNCVLNLAADKSVVFKEIFRVLRDGGSFTIADVVSEKEVPEHMCDDTELWGECISGALEEREFFRLAREAGFYGLYVKTRTFYREVDGLRFDSITVSGYKAAGGDDCLYKGHYAIYNGPMSSVFDDDGHEFTAGRPEEVSTDTARKLSLAPYSSSFTVVEPQAASKECAPEKDGGGKCC